MPLFLALVSSLVYVFVSRNASNLAYFRRVRFRTCGFDRQAPVDPASFLSWMTVVQICLVAVSLLLLSLYIVPFVLLLSPEFAKPLTRGEVTNCTSLPSDALCINNAYTLTTQKSCDDVMGTYVYHCNVFEPCVEVDPCRINLGTGLNVFALGSDALLVFLTLVANAINVVDIAQTQRMASSRPRP